MPVERSGGVRVFPGQSVRKIDRSATVGKILLMHLIHLFHLLFQQTRSACGKHGDTVLLAFAVAHGDLRPPDEDGTISAGIGGPGAIVSAVGGAGNPAMVSPGPGPGLFYCLSRRPFMR